MSPKDEPHIHIIGAGLAGLSAALQLTLMNQKVSLYEASPWAGGRCRSYCDPELGCLIDNGTHLVLSGNIAVQDYLELSGAKDTMSSPGKALFPFMDVETNDRWVIDINKGIVPTWLFDKNKRLPKTIPSDYMESLKLLFASKRDKVGDLLPEDSRLFTRFWEPLTISALNTEMFEASAEILVNLFKQSFAAGGDKCIPMLPKIGMSESFVDPCLKTLEEHGTKVHFGSRLSSIETEGKRVKALNFRGEKIIIKEKDWVILALPPWMTSSFVPNLTTPTEFRSIANIHYKLEAPSNSAGFTGIIGGLAEWVFVKKGIVSTTISVSNRYKEPDMTSMGVEAWKDIAKLFDLDPEKVPPFKIVRERRATIASTPSQNALRPDAYIGWENLALAGDWTNTGLPSCIEGTLRSGVKAAQVVMRWQEA